MTTKLHQIFPGPRGSLGRAVATVLACLTLLTVPLGAQDRLKGMPGYDRFMEMAPPMAPSLVAGAVRPVWAEDGKSFQYAHAAVIVTVRGGITVLVPLLATPGQQMRTGPQTMRGGRQPSRQHRQRHNCPE